MYINMVLAAVRQNGDIFGELPESWRRNREVALAVTQAWPDCLDCFDAETRKALKQMGALAGTPPQEDALTAARL